MKKNIESRESLLARLDVVIVNALFVLAFLLVLAPGWPTVLPKVATCFFVLSAGGWLVKLCLTRGQCYRRAPFDRLILLLVVLSFASVFVSPDKGFSFYNYYHLMGQYMLIYYLVLQNITTMSDLKKLITVMAVSAVIVILYAYYQYIFGIDVTSMLWVDGEKFPELKTRVFSTLQNPNILAGYLLVIMFIVFGLWCKIAQKRSRILLTLFFAAAGICLAMTYCRGAWISVLAILLSYCAVKRRFILIPMVLAVVGAGVLDQSLAERFFSAFNGSDTSSSMRLGIWESTIAMIIEHPVFGIGWGAYWLVYPYYDFFVQDRSVLIFHAHNMYLNIAAEIGIFGALAFFAIMFGHMMMAFKNTRLRQSEFLNGLTLGCGFSLLAIALNGLTDYVLFNTELSMLYWLICAVIVIICRRSLD